MPKLPAISGAEAIAAFRKAGFAVARIRSSHHIMTKPGHPLTLAVPVHGNKPLATRVRCAV